MRYKKFTPQYFENILIENFAAEGKAIARINEQVVFVTGVVPGDIADLKITKSKKNYKEAIATRIVKYSDNRATPLCEHFGICGGCKWQNMPYQLQLQYKQQQVIDAFERIAKVPVSEISTISGSEKTYYYRNKLEYTFSALRWLTADEMQIPDAEKQTRGLGFHVPGRFDKVLDINFCHLQPEPSNAIRLAIKKYAIDNKISFYDLKQQTGFLRNIVIKTTTTGQTMLILIVNENKPEIINNILQFIADTISGLTSLMYIVNPKKNSDYSDLEAISFMGPDYITEKMGDLHFRIHAKSFYQTNPEQAYNLYKVAADFAQLTGKEIVYDLYTGTGTIANFVAKKAKKVIGIEYVKEAIANAVENSVLNNIDNTLFFAGDMKNVLTPDFIAENGNPDVIILDPPRAGVHEDVLNTIMTCNPEKIVYVSCNPATQARDVALMTAKYTVTKIQPVDMFPQTHHVENVILLEKLAQPN